MDNRTNTIAGWALAGCTAALGLSIISGMYFHSERPENMGYPIEGVEEAGGGAEEVPIATLLASADLAAGEASFAKCAACHTINQGGANGIGPNLWGVMGKSHGHIAGFAFSDALTSIPGDWDFQNMSDWLASPRRYAPGTKMTFAGLSNPQERANMIAWMNTQGSNLPLPAAPAPGEEAAAEGAEGEADAAANATDADANTTDAAAENATAAE